ncbi:MAG: 4-hydroxy-tetrahydrodipicolinate reductase [Clostridiales bacterium]|nr:4-hydroxy-tetrahydrodipicolinate reductase [Clostridiales bacterium]
MIKLLLNGCLGKMGKVIAQQAESRDDYEIIAGVDICEGSADFPIYRKYADIPDSVTPDLIIDFSHPSVLKDELDYAVNKKIPVVVATTGLNDEQKNYINEAAKVIPVFFSANMSIGINLLAELARKAASILSPDFDIEILEMHHNQKLDAPSGTAILLADALKEGLEFEPEYIYERNSKRQKRGKEEIGISSIRGGNIVGEHEIIFAGQDEVIKISHSAHSKTLFANGSLNAGKFLINQEAGLYSMRDMLK